jgi:hypothetical protein
MINCKYFKDKKCVNFNIKSTICTEYYNPELQCKEKRKHKEIPIKSLTKDEQLAKYYRITREELENKYKK